MYFSSVFPYAVLFIFLVRGLMLDGAMEGIAYMFYPKVSTIITIIIIYLIDFALLITSRISKMYKDA